MLKTKIATEATIKYGAGNVSIDTDGLFYAIEINYKGIINCDILLPNTFMYAANNNKIVIVRLSKDNFPSKFIQYVGNLKITSARVLTNTPTPINVQLEYDENFFYNKSVAFNNLTSKFEDIGEDYPYIEDSLLPYKSTFKQSLTTNKQNFIDKDGNIYEGDYNIDKNGVIRSGAIRSASSVVLTRKDLKNFKIKSIARKTKNLRSKNG